MRSHIFLLIALLNSNEGFSQPLKYINDFYVRFNEKKSQDQYRLKHGVFSVDNVNNIFFWRNRLIDSIPEGFSGDFEVYKNRYLFLAINKRKVEVSSIPFPKRGKHVVYVYDLKTVKKIGVFDFEGRISAQFVSFNPTQKSILFTDGTIIWSK